MTDLRTTEQKARPAATLMYTFNVILTYEEAEQELFDISLPAAIPENAFVANIISGTEPNTPQLVKISSCMTGASRGGVPLSSEEYSKLKLPDYLAKRNGKYYFVDVGHSDGRSDEDPDIARWKGFRDGFILATRMAASRRAKS